MIKTCIDREHLKMALYEQFPKWVDWLIQNYKATKSGGCCTYWIGKDHPGKYRYAICMGWQEGYDSNYYDNPDEPCFAKDEGWQIIAKVGMQTKNNKMQTDIDIDFDMPTMDNGDVWDTDIDIRYQKDGNYKTDVDYLVDQWFSIVEFFNDKELTVESEEEEVCEV